MLLRRFLFLVLSAVALCLGGLRVAASTTYVYTDLGSLPVETQTFAGVSGNITQTLTQSAAYGISNTGQVVGTENITASNVSIANPHGSSVTDEREFSYFGGTTHSFGTYLNGNNSSGYGINSAGQIAGSSDVAGASATEGVLFSNGTYTSLASLIPDGQSKVNAVNEAGHITGWTDHEVQLSQTSFLTVQKVMFWKGSNPVILADLTSSQDGSFIASAGQAINNSDQVAGWSDVSVSGTFTTHACLMQLGHAAIDLGTLPGAANPAAVSYANGINNAGEVCGYSTAATGSNNHAFLYTGGVIGSMVDLGALTGGQNSYANGINNNGTIIGYGDEGVPGINYAMVYANGGMQDLNTLTSGTGNWVMEAAYAINDYGQIAGTAVNNLTGATHGFLLTPTNEATPPSVSTPPNDFQAPVGQNVTIVSNITGSSPLSFQWYNNGAPISGATSANLSLTNVQSGDSANYSVIGTNLVGAVTTNATLTVTSPIMYPAGYTAWAAGLNLIGASLLPAAMPFGDTLPNLARFAMNIGAVPTAGQLPVTSMQVVNGVTYLRLDYNVSKNLSGLQLTVQYSYDLQNWSALSNANIAQLADPNPQTSHYQASIAVPANGSVYLRLVVQPE